MNRIVFAIRHILGLIVQEYGVLTDSVLRKGCDFSEWVEMDEIGFDGDKGNKYQPTLIRIDRIIGAFYHITPCDSIIDVGCGKGYAMYLLHKLGFGAVAGFDLNPELVKIANDNFEKLGYDNCRAMCGDAEEYADYDDYNYFYIFNSVPPEVFKQTLDRIGASLDRKPREARLIYVNPQCHELVLASGYFQIDRIKKGIMTWFDVYSYAHHI